MNAIRDKSGAAHYDGQNNPFHRPPPASRVLSSIKRLVVGKGLRKMKNYQTNPFSNFRSLDKYRGFFIKRLKRWKKRTHFATARPPQDTDLFHQCSKGLTGLEWHGIIWAYE
jgi:hypothetical protein